MIAPADDPVLLMEPVTAWRAWWATPIKGHWRLYSLRGPGPVWEPRKPIEARQLPAWYSDLASDHESPCVGSPSDVRSCGCGIYGIKRAYADRLSGVASEWAWACFDDRTVTIVGTVSLWGRIVEHARGYRAQYGYPQAICDLGVVRAPMWQGSDDATMPTTRGVREIAEAYGIPIVRWDVAMSEP